VRIRRAIFGAQSLLMQTQEANFAMYRSVRFVGDDYSRNEALTSMEFLEPSLLNKTMDTM
jgi:hypothetical protein